jgi:hypothetical protein
VGDRAAEGMHGDEFLVDERPGARPYQARPLPASRPKVGMGREESGVRPYVLTGGRTRSSNALVGFETMVTLTPDGHQQRAAEANERRAILDRCGRPISVVELSAHLRLPLAVAQVLAGDLADEGFLQVHAAPEMPSRDRDLLERLALAVQNKQKEVA